METYIFLSTKDLKALKVIANNYQLSLSTTCGIIIKWYFLPINALYKTYIQKGKNQLHIKVKKDIKEMHAELNCMNATNCIYCYLNHPQNEVKFNWRNLNMQIKKELETTIDKNVNKNLEMRIAWRLNKGTL